jgi:hypothetical protein
MPFTLLSASSISGGVGDSLRPNAKPIIINGDMAVAQRGTSNTSITSAGYYTCDRFKFNRDGIGTWTVTQESLSSGNAYNNGFRKAIRLDCTSATASPSAADNLSLITRLEGQDLQLFKKGTSNAEKFTLAFWVKSNKTGTSQVNLRDTDNTRLISATYTISSANTWEHKVLNYAADTTGPFNNDNANSLQIEWFLDSGTNFSSGTAPTSWEASDNTDRNANNLALGNSTDNDFAITGIQLEVGEYTSSTLPPFQHEDFGNNLKRCQRYFQYSHFLGGFRRAILKGIVNQAQCFVDFPLMRTSPSLTLYGQGSTRGQSGKVYYDSGGSGLVFVAPNETSVGSNGFYMNIYSPNTSYNYYLDGYEVSAEL